MSLIHLFLAAAPDPKPRGWQRWLDADCRASCSCGWRADVNSPNTASAGHLWSVHRAAVTEGARS